MSLFSAPEFKVGVMVILVSGLIGGMSMKLSKGPGMLGGVKRHHFYVDNASGLVRRSAVRMAGIKVGMIEDIELVDGQARITVVLEKDAPVTETSRVILRADGILGDRHVEILPGRVEEKPVPPGRELVLEPSTAGLEEIMGEVTRLTSSLIDLAESLKRANQDEGDLSSPLGRILLNIERVSGDLAQMTDDNRVKIGDVMTRLQSVSRNLDQYINEASLSRLDASLRNIEDITEKINRGEGTVGRLINDDSTIQEINTAITSINTFLGGFASMETSIDFHSEYFTTSDMTKSYLGVKLQPGLDRYYQVQIIDDPRGVSGRVVTETSIDGGPLTSREETTTYSNRVKFSVLFAKNFYDLTLKGGIIQNSGGLGVDYHFFNRRLRLSLELFDLEAPYLRSFARYNILQGIYLIGGVDDAFAQQGPANTFIGGGIFITNDDLKTLATRISF